MMATRCRIHGLKPDEIKQLKEDKLNLPSSMDDFYTALKKVSKSVSADDLKKYEKWMKDQSKLLTVLLKVPKKSFKTFV